MFASGVPRPDVSSNGLLRLNSILFLENAERYSQPWRLGNSSTADSFAFALVSFVFILDKRETAASSWSQQLNNKL